MKSELAAIRQQLVDWKREWDGVDRGENPPPPPSDAIDRLISLATSHPTTESVLRELCDVQCLTGARLAAASTLRKIIAISDSNNQKQTARDRMRLKALAIPPGVETDPFLAAIELSRDDFTRLAEHIDTVANAIPKTTLDGFDVTESWVKRELGYLDDEWQVLRSQLWNAGAYNDFYVRDRYLEMQS